MEAKKHKIPKVRAGLIFFKRPFLYSGELMYGRDYV